MSRSNTRWVIGIFASAMMAGCATTSPAWSRSVVMRTA